MRLVEDMQGCVRLVGDIVTGVTMWMNLLEFVKVLFLKVLQLHRRLGDAVYNARNPCQPQFVTGHIAIDEKLVM